jgi:hypothetical protein
MRSAIAEREERWLLDPFLSRFPERVVWTADHLEPFGVIQGPQRQLRRAVGGLEYLRLLDRAQVCLVRLVAHAILRQRFVGELDRQRLAVEPDGRVIPCQTMFAVDAPVAETEVAQPVEPATEARPVEQAVQDMLARGKGL